MRQVKILLMILGASACAWAGWEGYRLIASSLSETAHKKDKRRVAVFGFSSETGEKTRASAIVTERLTNEIAGSPNLEVIERSRLDEVMKEQKLSAGGAVDSVTARRIGTILGADAVVTGTVIELDDKNVEVNARLVDTQDARILKAVTRNVKKDWEEKKKDPWGSLDFNMDIKLDTPMPLLPDGFLEDETCRPLTDEEKSFVKMCVELRARSTAHGLKTGALKLENLTRNPGSEIKNQDLKHHYYAKIKEWYYAVDLKRLTPQEDTLLLQGAPMIEKYPCR
jgi:TolB-like protein